MFLTKEELQTVSTAQVVNLITAGRDETVNNLIAENIDAIKSYLFKYYDTDQIFNQEGTDRSRIILKHLKALVIADIYLIREGELPESMQKRYDEAMRWMEKVAKGDIEPDLPKTQVDVDGDGIPDEPSRYMKLGSRKSYGNHF